MFVFVYLASVVFRLMNTLNVSDIKPCCSNGISLSSKESQHLCARLLEGQVQEKVEIANGQQRCCSARVFVLYGRRHVRVDLGHHFNGNHSHQSGVGWRSGPLPLEIGLHKICQSDSTV